MTHPVDDIIAELQKLKGTPVPDVPADFEKLVADVKAAIVNDPAVVADAEKIIADVKAQLVADAKGRLTGMLGTVAAHGVTGAAGTVFGLALHWFL